MSERGRSPGPSGPGGSRHASQSPPARSGSGSPSRAPGGQGPVGYPKPLGYDPAKPADSERKFNRVELPADAYAIDRGDLFAQRPKPATGGQVAPIEVNQYRVRKMDFAKKIYQYDVSISPQPSKPGPVLKKIWQHPTFIGKFPTGVHQQFIFDGRKLAWASSKVPGGEMRVMVDLDEGKPEKGSGQSQFYIILKLTTEINMAVLQAYIGGKVSFNNAVLEAMNFFDHLLRASPSQRLLSIKRNFYDTSAPGRPLLDGAVVEVRKGLYWSARLSTEGIGLGINADVANTCFFVGNQDFPTLVSAFLSSQDRSLRGMNPGRLDQALRPVQTPKGPAMSEAFKQLKKLAKLKVVVKHAGRPEHLTKPIGVESFTFDARNGLDGANARNTTFQQDGKTISVEDYFRQKYNVRLRYPMLPLIKTGKGALIPMELAFLEPYQRYPFKLSPDQTAAMIKIAVTRPRDRRQDIERNVAGLRIGNDPFLRHYGVEIEPSFTKTEGSVLPPPKLFFGQGDVDPKFAGRWSVQGKRFWKQNTAPLDSWGFLILTDRINQQAVERFSGVFRQIYRGHGGQITRDPLIINPPGNCRNNPAEAMLYAFEQLKAKSGYPQMLFVIVSQRGDPAYERIKKSADCRFGIGTQVVAAQGVQAAQAQFASNIALKINAKLGGATSRTIPPFSHRDKTYFPKDRPTMIVGCDISHPAPGAPMASVAAMTMSVDADANRYAAAVQTNGRRQEMLTQDNVHGLFGQLVQYWKSGHPGQFPKHIIYLRDGVSEGEFAKVLDIEVAHLKSFFTQNTPKAAMPAFTVLVATKRHHIRMFPVRGDKNSNALPGTVLEKEVTNPRMYDFYLNSHVAIQGTARPAHYHVLRDEMGIPANDLQRMLYEQCYSYARATTPVSMHPAIYYAHLAGARARAHENVASSEGARTGGKGHQIAQINLAKGASMSSQSGDAPPLLALGGTPAGQPAEGEVRQRNFLRSTMWFI